MDDGRRDLAAEFRVLAESVLDRIEPVLRRIDAENGPEWQGCSWCPFCALAAALRGERHDLVTLMAGELDGFLDVLRDFLQAHGTAQAHGPAQEGGIPGTERPDGPPVVRPASYQPITVIRSDVPQQDK